MIYRCRTNTLRDDHRNIVPYISCDSTHVLYIHRQQTFNQFPLLRKTSGTMTANGATNGTKPINGHSKSQNLKNNKAKLIVDHAFANHYAIPAVCCYNLEAIIATVRAAEKKSSPALIQLFPWSIEYADGLLLHAAAEAASKANVPIAVHMDHAQDPDIIRRSADLGGFDGIMVDMSHYDKEENMKLSRELVEYCNVRGIITEVEPGRINGSEDGIADTVDLAEVLTTPKEAEEFVALGIDWLAPAFGNVHGAYGPKGPILDFSLLESVAKKVGDRVRLVLHGAHEDYFQEELLRKCIGYGMAKVNINGPVAAAWTKTGKELTGKKPLTEVLERQTQAMQEVVEYHMDFLMSTGKYSPAGW